MNAPSPWALLDSLDAQLQHLTQGHFGPVLQQLDSGNLPPELADWLGGKLLRPNTDPKHFPPAQRHLWQGWLAFQQGDYPVALAELAQEHSTTTPATELSRALGLGRVLTRTGHWHSAQGWLLYALQHARVHNRLHDLMRVYGALGELLLRAGWTREALFCMKAAYHLLPAGAGERPRQQNYLASVLLRLGQPSDYEQAEHLLMNSYYLSQQPRDVNSQYHTLARLQFLELDRHGQRDVQTWLAHWPQEQPSAPVVQGYLHMGRGLAALRREEQPAARQHFEQAQQAFAQHFPGEARWASLALAAQQRWQGQTAPTHWPSLFTDCTPPVPPPSDSLIDRELANISLSDQGLKPLEQTPETPAALDSLRSLFFI